MNTRLSIAFLLALVPAATAQERAYTARPVADDKVVSADTTPISDDKAVTSVSADTTPASETAAAVPIPWEVSYANCDGSAVFPTVNPNDLICFLNRLAIGDLYVNCDGSTLKPLITANDLICFLNAYAFATAWQDAQLATDPASVKN
jgi:hypothetical protein